MGGCPVPDGRRKPALVEPLSYVLSHAATGGTANQVPALDVQIALRARPRQPRCAQNPVFPLEAVTVGFPEERGAHCFTRATRRFVLAAGSVLLERGSREQSLDGPRRRAWYGVLHPPRRLDLVGARPWLTSHAGSPANLGGSQALARVPSCQGRAGSRSRTVSRPRPPRSHSVGASSAARRNQSSRLEPCESPSPTQAARRAGEAALPRWRGGDPEGARGGPKRSRRAEVLAGSDGGV